MSNKYILRGRTPEPIDNVLEWATWYETADRTVAKTQVGKLNVSTIFLGLDHNFSGNTPILFETMIFGMGKDYQERYATWEEAEAGHKAAVEIARVAEGR